MPYRLAKPRAYHATRKSQFIPSVVVPVVGTPTPPAPVFPAALLTLDGVSSRSASIRWDVLDAGLNLIGQVYPDREQVVPEIVNSSSRSIKRTCQGFRLSPSDAAALNTLTDRIRPVWEIGGYDFSRGVFLFGEAPRDRHSYGVGLQATLVDQCFILDQPTEVPVSYTAGFSAPAAMTEQAEIAGLTSLRIDGSGAVTGNPATWPAGTSRLQILADLCLIAGFLPPYFDNAGFLVCRASPDPDNEATMYSYADGGTIIADSIVESDNMLTAPNRYIVVGSGANALPAAGYFDVPNTAPNSIGQRGIVVGRVYNVGAVHDSATAIVAARGLYLTDPQGYFLSEFDAIPDPRLDTFDLVEYLGDRYICDEWVETEQATGLQHLRLKRLYADG